MLGTKYRSDHAPVYLTFTLSNHIRGPGTWKLNNSLLLDEEFIILIKKEINNFKLTYAATPYNPDFVTAISHNFELMISASLFWETLLVTLRGIIIRYSRKKKRDRNRARKVLETEIDELDSKINTGLGTRENQIQLAELNRQLIQIRKLELDGALVRSRADWLEYGERPSKYFLNLENKNRINKNINEILLDNDQKVNDQDTILIKLKEFYEDLYKEKDHRNNIDYDPEINPLQITEQEKEILERPISKEELERALGKMKNNKSPGLDGYSAEFYKKFWPQLGDFFLNAIIENYENGALSNSQTEGVITCLPKTGKERNKLKIWRPISLLNTSYKLISLCITNRIRPLLHSIISPEQKGFIEGRSISKCTRLMLDIIHECEAQNKAGLILLVDFEKAFDSLSWNFIHEILPKFNFGENFIKWIHMFQQNSKARVILNGHLSEPFLLHRGCRQGDPISPYIFILCAEYLALAFKKEENFKGIKLLNKDHRLSLYADDTSILMEASDENLDMSLKILEWFYMKSGLKINYTKTKVIRIGSIRETDRRFGRKNALDWVHEFTALGIDNNILDIKNITKTNIESKIESMKCITKALGCRNIAPVGRITVLKSLVLSKITHVLLSLPTPYTETLTIIDDLCYKFIWKGRHEVSKSTLC